MFKDHNSYLKLDRNWKGTLLGQKIKPGAKEWNSMLALTWCSSWEMKTWSSCSSEWGRFICLLVHAELNWQTDPSLTLWKERTPQCPKSPLKPLRLRRQLGAVHLMRQSCHFEARSWFIGLGGNHWSVQCASACCHAHLETPHAAFSLDWDYACPEVIHASLEVGCLNSLRDLALPE